MTLNQLFLKYGSDKAEHGYAEFYEAHLPEDPKCLIEFGVKEGNSIRAWKEYFPSTRIIGIDLFQEFPIPDIPGVEFIKAHQCDHELLYNIRHNIKPDVVIDDASHNSRDQLVTFYSLFTHGMKYFIEDIHCCKHEMYRDGLPFHFTACTFGIPSIWSRFDPESPIMLIHL